MDTTDGTMIQNFTHSTLGSRGSPVHRFGLSATYRPGRDVIHRALDEGMNFFFAYGFDSQMIKTLRDEFGKDRQRYIIATGAYNLLLGHTDIRRTCEKRMRQLKTDYIDVFLLLGITKPGHFTGQARDDLYRLRDEGKIRYAGISCHDRSFAGKLASDGVLDALMIRYNAAHRGAEQDIYPYLATHDPGIISYTATRWSYLLKRPRGWPQDGRIPTAAMCYRFVLTNPHVDVCLTAPSNMEQFDENLQALRQGPLDEVDMKFMKEFGDVVHHTKKWFM